MFEQYADRSFVCPHCGQRTAGDAVIYPIASGHLYVCRRCGCIQDPEEVKRQLGEDFDKED